ncbi:MAG: flagellin FliC [Bdellovibrio sp.]|nr:MAG: flagellin FliC [Bdellovibrio sp.]
MAFTISTDAASMAARRSLSLASKQVESSLKALASGSRVSNASDDAAGFAISERLRGQISGIKQSRFNAQNAKALIQTAEGGLNEQNNILIRMRELAVNAASDSVGDEEREFLNMEFVQLRDEFDRIAQSTRFGNKKLLVGTEEEFAFHVGPFNGPENVVKFKLDANTTAMAVGINRLEITDQDDALDAIEDLDDAVQSVSKVRAQLGAAQSRFEHVINNLEVQQENLTAARSLITDVDVAEEVSKLTQGQIQTQAGTMVLSQANANSLKVLQLLA